MGCDESKAARSAEPIGTLHYFPFHGRAEPIRLMLNKADVNFTDNRITFADWPASKADMPGGVMPVWEEKGMKLGETIPLMRMLGKRYGFYSTNPKQAWVIDSELDFLSGC